MLSKAILHHTEEEFHERGSRFNRQDFIKIINGRRSLRHAMHIMCESTIYQKPRRFDTSPSAIVSAGSHGYLFPPSSAIFSGTDIATRDTNHVISKTRLEVWAALNFRWTVLSTNLPLAMPAMSDRRIIRSLDSALCDLYTTNSEVYDTCVATLCGIDAMTAAYVTTRFNKDLNLILSGLFNDGFPDVTIRELVLQVITRHCTDAEGISLGISVLVELGGCHEPREHRFGNYYERQNKATNRERVVGQDACESALRYGETMAEVASLAYARRHNGLPVFFESLGMPFFIVAIDMVRQSNMLIKDSDYPKTQPSIALAADPNSCIGPYKLSCIIASMDEANGAVDIPFDTCSCYFCKEREKGRLRGPAMATPECRAGFIHVNEFMNACAPGARYVKYIGKMDIPTLAKQIEEMFSDHVFPEGSLPWSMSIDLSAFCLSISTELNSMLLEGLKKFIPEMRFVIDTIKVMDFIGNAMSSCPTIQSLPRGVRETVTWDTYRRIERVHLNMISTPHRIDYGADYAGRHSIMRDTEQTVSIPDAPSNAKDHMMTRQHALGSPEGLLQSLWSSVLLTAAERISEHVRVLTGSPAGMFLLGDNLTLVFAARKSFRRLPTLVKKISDLFKTQGQRTKPSETVAILGFAVPLRAHLRLIMCKQHIVARPCNMIFKPMFAIGVKDMARLQILIGVTAVLSQVASMVRTVVDRASVLQYTKTFLKSQVDYLRMTGTLTDDVDIRTALILATIFSDEPGPMVLCLSILLGEELDPSCLKEQSMSSRLFHARRSVIELSGIPKVKPGLPYGRLLMSVVASTLVVAPKDNLEPHLHRDLNRDLVAIGARCRLQATCINSETVVIAKRTSLDGVLRLNMDCAQMKYSLSLSNTIPDGYVAVVLKSNGFSHGSRRQSFPMPQKFLRESVDIVVLAYASMTCEARGHVQADKRFTSLVDMLGFMMSGSGLSEATPFRCSRSDATATGRSHKYKVSTEMACKACLSALLQHTSDIELVHYFLGRTHEEMTVYTSSTPETCWFSVEETVTVEEFYKLADEISTLLPSTRPSHLNPELQTLYRAVARNFFRQTTIGTSVYTRGVRLSCLSDATISTLENEDMSIPLILTAIETDRVIVMPITTTRNDEANRQTVSDAYTSWTGSRGGGSSDSGRSSLDRISTSSIGSEDERHDSSSSSDSDSEDADSLSTDSFNSLSYTCSSSRESASDEVRDGKRGRSETDSDTI